MGVYDYIYKIVITYNKEVKKVAGIGEKILTFINDEEGISTAEIAIIGAFLAVCAAGLSAYLLPRIRNLGNRVGEALENSEFQYDQP